MDNDHPGPSETSLWGGRRHTIIDDLAAAAENRPEPQRDLPPEIAHFIGLATPAPEVDRSVETHARMLKACFAELAAPADFAPGTLVEPKEGFEGMRTYGAALPFRGTGRIGIVVDRLSPEAAREGPPLVPGVKPDILVLARDPTDGEMMLCPVDSRFFRTHSGQR